MPRSLQQIYASLPKMECKRLCQNQCSIIPHEPAEADAIFEAHGIRLIGLEDIGIWELEGLRVPTCPALSREGRCTVYKNRPLICRLFGMVQAMECPHRCKPERLVTDEEAKALILEIQALTRKGI